MLDALNSDEYEKQVNLKTIMQARLQFYNFLQFYGITVRSIIMSIMRGNSIMRKISLRSHILHIAHPNALFRVIGASACPLWVLFRADG